MTDLREKARGIVRAKLASDPVSELPVTQKYSSLVEAIHAALVDAEKQGRKKGLEEAATEIPTNWLHRLLTGPESPGEMPWSCPQVERLLLNIQKAIRSLQTESSS